jgi:catechol 2,3-dioxygenase-like lactoylglutathione lyase family enzyme
LSSDTADSAGLVDRIDHVVLAVRDVAAAASTMARLLGCAPSWQGDQPADGTSNVLFRLANATIELLGPAGEGPVGASLRSHVEEHGEGLYRIDFGTHDLEAVRAGLSSHGIEITEPRDALSHDEPSGAWRRYRVMEIPATANRGIRTRVVEDASPDEIVPSAQPQLDDGSCVARLDHVVVMTSAPDHALAFYGDALGLRLALDKTFEKRGVRLVFFRTGGLTLEIGSSLRGASDLGEAGSELDVLWGLAHQVADADLARARVEASGHAVSAVRDGHKPGTRVFSVQGAPLGVPTLFIEPVKTTG